MFGFKLLDKFPGIVYFRKKMKRVSMSKIKITQATSKDISEIGKIAYQVGLIHAQQIKKEFKKPTLKSQTAYIRQSIDNKDILVLKAHIDDVIVGYVVVYFNTYPFAYFQLNKRAFVGSIGVEENYQRCGVGRALLKAVEKEIKKRKISVIEIDYYTFNVAAENLYKNCGYKETKRYMRKFV